MASRRVTPWSKNVKELAAQDGDLIEFDRGTYKHWAVCIGDGQVMHFNPTNSEEKVGVLRLKEFLPGIVTKASLEKVAGSSYVRVNNMPEVAKQPRSLDHMHGLRKILVNKPGFYYCLQYFNCEHFATYVKFGEGTESSQISLLEGFLSGGLSRIRIAGMNAQDLFNKLAYMQWWENTNASYTKHVPRHILQDGLLEWQNA